MPGGWLNQTRVTKTPVMGCGMSGDTGAALLHRSARRRAVGRRHSAAGRHVVSDFGGCRIGYVWHLFEQAFRPRVQDRSLELMMTMHSPDSFSDKADTRLRMKGRNDLSHQSDANRVTRLKYRQVSSHVKILRLQ